MDGQCQVRLTDLEGTREAGKTYRAIQLEKCILQLQAVVHLRLQIAHTEINIKCPCHLLEPFCAKDSIFSYMFDHSQGLCAKQNLLSNDAFDQNISGGSIKFSSCR